MAQRGMDNGKGDTRGMQHPHGAGESPTQRGADVAPPGSRERAEGHVTGWSPEKEAESLELRQGPFHRAATERLYNPRGGVDAGDVGPLQDGRVVHGPSGMQDVEDNWRRERALRLGQRYEPHRTLRARDEDTLRWDDTARTWREDAGPSREGVRYDERGRLAERVRRGEHDLRGEAVSAEYRSTRGGDRYADERYDDERRALRERDVERYGRRGYRDERYDPTLGLDWASPGIPGRGVGPGNPRGGGYETRGSAEELPEGRRRWAREPLTAREIMTRGVKSVRRDSPLREVAQLMKDEDCGVVPIVDERGTLVGLVTDRDLVIRAFTGAKSPDTLRAGDVMTDDVRAVTQDENVHSVIELMGRRQVRRVPVVDRDDRLLGIISMGDIANRADYDEELQEALDRVSARRSFWNRLG